MEATVLPRARCNPAWFTSLMLKKRVAALDGEVRADYVTAAKQSVLDYILLEVREVVVVTVMMICCQEEERTRLDISVRPRPWEPRVVRAPVPWHQSFLQVRGGGANGGGANGGEGYGGANGGDVGDAGQPVLQTQPLLPQHGHGQAERPLVAQVRQGA